MSSNIYNTSTESEASTQSVVAQTPQTYGQQARYARRSLEKLQGTPEVLKNYLLYILLTVNSKTKVTWHSQRTIAADLQAMGFKGGERTIRQYHKLAFELGWISVPAKSKGKGHEIDEKLKGRGLLNVVSPILTAEPFNCTNLDKHGNPRYWQLTTETQTQIASFLQKANAAVLRKHGKEATKATLSAVSDPADTAALDPADTAEKQHFCEIETVSVKVETTSQATVLPIQFNSLSPPEPASEKEKAKASPGIDAPLSCREFVVTFMEYNPKWIWTQSCIDRFKANWKNNPEFRALSRKIMSEIQSNTELARLCPNLDPNHLFRVDSQGGMVWQKLVTGVAYFSSTKKPVPETNWDQVMLEQAAKFAAEDSRRERHNTMLKSLTDAEWQERLETTDKEAWDKARLGRE